MQSIALTTRFLTTLDAKHKLSAARATLQKATHVGLTLLKLRREEGRLSREFAKPERTVAELCQLICALDKVRERRRIILGIPLPGVNGRQRTLDLGPAGPTMDAQLIADSTGNISPAHPSSTEEPR